MTELSVLLSSDPPTQPQILRLHMIQHDLMLVDRKLFGADESARRRSGTRGKEARAILVQVEAEREAVMERSVGPLWNSFMGRYADQNCRLRVVETGQEDTTESDASILDRALALLMEQQMQIDTVYMSLL